MYSGNHITCFCLLTLSAVCFTVGIWLGGSDTDNYLSSVDSKFSIMKEINNKLSVAQLDQLTARQTARQDDFSSDHTDDDSSLTLDLTVDIASAGGDRLMRRGLTIGGSDLGSSVADLTAEVDFEIGPDVSSESDLLYT